MVTPIPQWGIVTWKFQSGQSIRWSRKMALAVVKARDGQDLGPGSDQGREAMAV